LDRTLTLTLTLTNAKKREFPGSRHNGIVHTLSFCQTITTYFVMVLFTYYNNWKTAGKPLKSLRKKTKFTSTSDAVPLTDGFDIIHNNSSSQMISKSSQNSNVSVKNIVENKISIEQNIDHTNWEIVNSFLANKGMKDHFESVLGGGMKTEAIKYIIRRTAELLIWTYQYKNKSLLEEGSVIYWFQTLILSDYILVQPFASKYLSGYRQLSPSTCLSYLTDFGKAINWFIWFRDHREVEFPIEGASAGGILSICSKLKKSYKPSLRKQRLNKTLEHLVESGHFPSGGLTQLQEVMVEDIEWAKDIDEHLVRTCIQSYNKFLAILIGAMYCESPQGRIGGK